MNPLLRRFVRLMVTGAVSALRVLRILHDHISVLVDNGPTLPSKGKNDRIPGLLAKLWISVSATSATHISDSISNLICSVIWRFK